MTALSRRQLNLRLQAKRHREDSKRIPLRRVSITVPDTRSPQFLAEARRQSLLIANSPSEADEQAFVDSIADWSEV